MGPMFEHCSSEDDTIWKENKKLSLGSTIIYSQNSKVNITSIAWKYLWRPIAMSFSTNKTFRRFLNSTWEQYCVCSSLYDAGLLRTFPKNLQLNEGGLGRNTCSARPYVHKCLVTISCNIYTASNHFHDRNPTKKTTCRKHK